MATGLRRWFPTGEVPQEVLVHPGSGALCPHRLGSVRLCRHQQSGKPGVGDADAAAGHGVIDVTPTVGRGGAPDDLGHARDRVAHWRSWWHRCRSHTSRPWMR
jgi:hypothetical protein